MNQFKFVQLENLYFSTEAYWWYNNTTTSKLQLSTSNAMTTSKEHCLIAVIYHYFRTLK